MLPSFKTAALAVLATVGATTADAQSLTRIETHGFYGSTVTIEEGVRVFRPLPSTGHMIINPGGRTPVSLNISESVHHYVGPGGGSVSQSGTSAGGVRAGGLPWLGNAGGDGKHKKSAHQAAGGRPVGHAPTGPVRGRAGIGHGHGHH